jgi:SAM-dependent methyltransferase
MDPDVEAVRRFYADGREQGRLSSSDVGPIEQEHLRELLLRFLPEGRCVVYDVGGAAGPYSFWLAGLGHEVHLVDVVSLHIERAREVASRPGSPQLASMTVADARETGGKASSADLVLMHGPLYHLTRRADRLAAIQEASRVLKPGGQLLAVGITMYASLLWGLLAGYAFQDGFLDMVREEVTTSQHRRPPGAAYGGFAQAYFHHPQELVAEVQEGGFAVRAVQGVVGPAWMEKDFKSSWSDPVRRDVLLQISRLAEAEPVLSPRTLVVGVKGR